MKIAVFAEYFPPHMGSDYRIWQIMKKLAKEKFGVHFIVFPPLRALAGFVDKSLIEYLARRRSETSPKGVNVFYNEVPSCFNKLWMAFMPMAYLLTLIVCLFGSVRLLRRIKPELVVVAHPSYLCGLAGIVAAKLLKLRVVLDYPDLWTPMATEMLSWSSTGIKSTILDKLEGTIVKLADHIVAVTHTIRMKALQLGVNEAKITVIPNGISLENIIDWNAPNGMPTLHKTIDEHVILYSGRLERWTDIESLIKAAPLVLSEFPNSRFVIVGDGTQVGVLKTLISNMQLQDKVILTGFIERDKVWNMIRSVDVCITSFSEGDTSDAALPIKLLEYMALGKPIVATKGEGITDFLKDNENALIIDPNHPESMASAILMLLRNRSLARSLGLNAHKIVKDTLDWKSLAHNFGRVCRSVLEEQAVFDC